MNLTQYLHKRNEDKENQRIHSKEFKADMSITMETEPLKEGSGYRVIREEERDGVKIVYVEKKSSMKIYYEKNRDKICKDKAEKMRDKYKNDPEYREKKKAVNREAHKKRMEKKAKELECVSLDKSAFLAKSFGENGMFSETSNKVKEKSKEV